MIAVAALVAALLTSLPAAPAPVAACTVSVRPGDAVGRAVYTAGAGAVVCFAPGTYRLTRPIRPLAGQTLEGGGARLVGSRVLTGWRRTAEASRWSSRTAGSARSTAPRGCCAT